eukprot:scaffold8920_cov84-Skeletonema_dohrnii-CCMP3373.AAC.5
MVRAGLVRCESLALAAVWLGVSEEVPQRAERLFEHQLLEIHNLPVLEMLQDEAEAEADSFLG